MTGWVEAIRAAPAGAPIALVTVLATEGSAPRGAGARLVVTWEGAAGSIGGGALEYRAIDQARAILAAPAGSWRIQDYPLGPLLGQCCGGRVRLLVERLGDERGWLDAAAAGATIAARLEAAAVVRLPFDGGDAVAVPSARGERPVAGTCHREEADERRMRLLLFGGGHVGSAIARLLPGLPIDGGWYDSRAEVAARPGIVLASEDELVACAREAPGDAAVVIVTHDHALDYRIAIAALRSRACYVGLIGSATKRARFLSRFAADGLDERQRARLVCPIGVAGITGKRPEVIAIAVCAELLALVTAPLDVAAREDIGDR